MTIELVDLTTHFEKYLKLCKKEDIYIARFGKIIAKLSDPYKLPSSRSSVEAEQKAYDATYDMAELERYVESRLIR